jgi:putative two-component system response regulator
MAHNMTAGSSTVVATAVTPPCVPSPVPPGSARVLVVDDLAQNRTMLRRILETEGYQVVTAADATAALAEVERLPPDLVLSDVQMPGLSGIELCHQLKSDPRTRLVPVVLITGLADRTHRLRGIDAGADDFLGKPFDIDELRARVGSLVRLKRYTDDLDSAESVILSLAMTVEARDPSTFGHCERLARYAVQVGEAIGLGPEQLKALHRGGYLHDIGKIAIPDAILFKPASLTEAEFRQIAQHTIVGERLCGDLRSLSLVRPIVRSHHERLDGSGYPDALKGDAVPLLAQIISIADQFDALTTDRPYRAALSVDEAAEQLCVEADAGRVDRALVDVLLKQVTAR